MPTTQEDFSRRVERALQGLRENLRTLSMGESYRAPIPIGYPEPKEFMNNIAAIIESDSGLRNQFALRLDNLAGVVVIVQENL
jgi:hypothetical protein